MRKGNFILISFVILIFFISVCFAEDTSETKIAVLSPDWVGGEISPMFGSSSLPPSWQNPTTCSMIWEGNCSEGPPESFKNTFDACDTGFGGDESINEVYVNTSSVLVGNQIEVKCEVMIWGIMEQGYGCGYGWKKDKLYIYYRNSSTAQWKMKYSFVQQIGSCMNYSVAFVPDSVAGVHQARCLDGYDIPQAECASGDFYDNDDVNFTVYAEFISVTIAEGAPIDFGTNANPGSVDFPAVNNPLIITVDSNIHFDITTKADDTDFTSAEDSFPISNMKWQLTPTSPLFSYSTSEATVYSNKTWGNFSMYHKITIPNGQKQGTYSADIVITAKKSV
jgi:hypothetical protein